MAIGKQELISRISEKTKYTKKDTEVIVNAFIETIETSMKNKEDVTITGFGSWKIQSVQARKGRNIYKNEEIVIPAHNRVKFTPGATLKATVENGSTKAEDPEKKKAAKKKTPKKK